ncbi:multidrug and toxin extrusion MATE family efflux pump YdhE/NorM [Geomicrobium sp. JCM 19037]|nr:multidrug and toxin extrusion MATE family efflux pump YdhE/NorM [Geomicrobium sp. JCM 19037]
MPMTTYTKGKRRLLVGILLSASFISVLNQFLLITAFPQIMSDFEINATEVQWLTTVFMLAIAILVPITAYLIDRFTSRALLLAAVFSFFIGTLVAALAPNFGTLLVGRILQGAGSGMMMPLMQTVLLLVYPREQRGFAMGLVGLVINVAPAIGPVISGLLVDSFSWRAVFYVTLPAVLLLMGFIYRYMENVTEQRPAKIDVLSVLLSSVAFGGILYGFNSTGSSTTAMLMIGIGSVALLLFIFRQLRLEKPMLELRTFKRPLFALVIVITALSFSLLIAVETILPMFVQNVQLYSAFDSGLIIFPGAMTLAVMSSWPANGLIGTAVYGSRSSALFCSAQRRSRITSCCQPTRESQSPPCFSCSLWQALR